MIESIKNYLETCPQLAGGKINIDCLGADAVSYSIDSIAAEPVVKKYCDGAVLKQFIFAFSLRDIYNENVLKNLKRAQLFEQIEDWITKQNQKGNLPDAEGIAPVKIEVTKSGCLQESNMQNGKWQMEMPLVYRQD